MTEQQQTSSRWPRLLAWGACVLFVLLGGGFLGAKLYLLSPLAPRQLGTVLTRQVGQPVTVAGLRLSLDGVALDGLRIGNPPGFAGPPLVEVRKVVVVPAWSDLAAGHYRLRTVRIDGVRAALAKNDAGGWNFSGLVRRPKKEGTAPELIVDRLEIADTACSVAGQRADGVTVTVTDLATRGSRRMTVAVKGRLAGTQFAISGTGRLGGRPEGRFTLTAPEIRPLATVKEGKGLALGEAVGSLFLNGSFAKGRLALDGTGSLRGGAVQLKGARLPVAADLSFRGGYRISDDTATLESACLSLSGRPLLEAGGTVAAIRGERRWNATLSWRRATLAELFTLVPPGIRRDLALAGTLAPGSLRLAGTRRHGVTVGNGRVRVGDGTLAKGGRLLVAGVSADLEVRRAAHGWEFAGGLRADDRGRGALVEQLTLPVRLTLSSRLALQRLDLPSFTGRVAGAPVNGSAGYRPLEPEPLRLSLSARPVRLKALGGLLPKERVRLDDGTGDLSLRLGGRSPRDCRGEFTARVTNVAAAMGGRPLSIASAAVDGSLTVAGNRPALAGSLTVGSMRVTDKAVAGSTRYQLLPETFALTALRLRLDNRELQAAGISGTVPRPQRRDDETIFPLSLRWNGVKGASGRYGIADCRGELLADLHMAPGRRWLAGTATIASAQLLAAGAQAGTLTARGVLKEGELMATLQGILLDGGVDASATLDPFAFGRGLAWRGKLSGVSLARVVTLVPGSKLPRVDGGRIDLQWDGSYRTGEGVGGTVRLAGQDISLADAKGKGILSDGAVRAVAELASGNLKLREAEIAVGPELKVAVSGDLTKAFTPDRSGTIRLTAPRTGVNALFDAFANRLPRSLQEATAGGDLAAETIVRVAGRTVTADGTVAFSDIKLDIPGHKLAVSGVEGTMPFSFVPSGTGRLPSRPVTVVSREHMGELLAAARRRLSQKTSLKVAKVRFGPMELADLQLVVTAGEGLTELTSLSALLYGGHLYGDGFFRLGAGQRYGGNLLLDDVSLRGLCDAFPAIKGYISGRLDGIVSLAGTAPGREGLVGFVDLWTRSSREEEMLVSKEFLQKLAGKKLRGFFFRTDRAYDRGEIAASLEDGILTFNRLDLSHTNFFGIKDLSVSVATVQNQISLEHLLSVVKEAASRGKAVSSGGGAPAETEFKWQE